MVVVAREYHRAGVHAVVEEDIEVEGVGPGIDLGDIPEPEPVGDLQVCRRPEDVDLEHLAAAVFGSVNRTRWKRRFEFRRSKGRRVPFTFHWTSSPRKGPAK